MLRKIAKTTLFATIIASALCAGAVSVHQLRSEAKGVTCGGRCSLSQPCAVAGCVCSFSTPLTGFCTTRLAGVVPPGK